MKSTLLGGRVLRARTPQGIGQEIYALLTAYQALRIAMADATFTTPAISDDQASFTIALNTARDQIKLRTRLAALQRGRAYAGGTVQRDRGQARNGEAIWNTRHDPETFGSGDW